MARWVDVVTLVEIMPSGNDDAGFPLPPTEKQNTIYCDKVSIGQSEFYKAAQAGIKAELKLKVHTVDYSGERICEFCGKRYEILRTFSPNNGEFTELTLTDIKEVDDG